MFSVFGVLNMTVYVYTATIFHDKWVPVTTAWRDFRIWIDERPPIWRVDANI